MGVLYPYPIHWRDPRRAYIAQSKSLGRSACLCWTSSSPLHSTTHNVDSLARLIVSPQAVPELGGFKLENGNAVKEWLDMMVGRIVSSAGGGGGGGGSSPGSIRRAGDSWAQVRAAKTL